MRACHAFFSSHMQLCDTDQFKSKPPLKVGWDQSGQDLDWSNAQSVRMRLMRIEFSSMRIYNLV